MAATQDQHLSPREEMTARVARAARRCFAEAGVNRTRMEDVARAAGLSRATLYRVVMSREELIELVLVEFTREMAEELASQIDPDADVQDSIVSVMIGAIDVSRANQEYNYLTDAIPRLRLTAFFATSRSPIHEILRIPLVPLLDRARKQHILRADLSDDEIVAWIQGAMFLLWPQGDLDDDAMARFIRRFAFPAIFPTDLPT
jgi:TetR/AcrR family transcriptional regulator, repressor for uid operon